MRQTYVRPEAEYINMTSFEEVLWGSGYRTDFCIPTETSIAGNPLPPGLYYTVDWDALEAAYPDGMPIEMMAEYCTSDMYCVEICFRNEQLAYCSTPSAEWYLLPTCDDTIGWNDPASPKYCGCGTKTL